MSRDPHENVEELVPRMADAKSHAGPRLSRGQPRFQQTEKGGAQVVDFARKKTTGKTPFYHLHLDNLNTREALDYCSEALRGDRSKTFFFINAHCFNVSKVDSEYEAALKQCDLLLNDGIGIRIASKMEGIELKENMNGTDFIPKVLHLAAETGEGVFLLGAKPGVADQAKDNLKKRIEGLNICGTRNGYFGADEEDQLIREINDSGASVLVVGLGVPAQEKWIMRNKARLTHARIILAGGAVIDFSAGRVKRAPVFMQKFGLEWLFRLSQEPVRLFHRYVVGNFRFLGLVAAHKIRSPAPERR